MPSITKLKVSKKFGLFIAIMLGFMLCSSVVHAGLAPDFTFTDIDGNAHSLSSFRGSVVILEFFEIQCSYCANEIGVLKTVYSTFGSSLVIISTSITDADTTAKLQQYRSANSIPWIVAGAVSGLFGGSYNAPSIPALFIIDQSGNLMYQNDWTASASALTGQVQGLLGTTSATLTVNTSPGLSTVHFTVDGTGYVTSSGSFSSQLTAGQHQVQLVDTTITEPGDTQYRFSHWSGLGSANPVQIEISGSSTLEADFDTYYQTVFVQTGSEGTSQVTVDGASYALPQTFWFETGSSHSFSYDTVSGGTGIQYVAASTSCTSPVTVSCPSTITGNYKTQYYVTVVSEHCEPAPSQWVDKGSTLVMAVTSTADDNGAGTRYSCTGYKIDGGSLQPGTTYAFENIQAPKEIDFQWTTQYHLTLNASPNCLILQPPGSPTDSWYDARSSVTFGAQAVNDCRLICWTVDGTSLVNTQLTVTMDNPHTATVGLLPP